MGVALDLAIAALTLIVLASLGMLAWTVGVSAARAADRARESVARLRVRVADAAARVEGLSR